MRGCLFVKTLSININERWEEAQSLNELLRVRRSEGGRAAGDPLRPSFEKLSLNIDDSSHEYEQTGLMSLSKKNP